jgi:cell division septal protein FtsQ
VSLQRYAKVDTNEERKQTMKRILLILLSIIVLLALFGAAGYTGYRFGYTQGVQTSVNGDSIRPGIRPFDDFNPRGMHNFGMDREFQRGFGPGRFPMRGFGFFSPLRWLAPLAVLALIALFVYWLFTRSGWHLTRQTTESIPPHPQPEHPQQPENE